MKTFFKIFLLISLLSFFGCTSLPEDTSNGKLVLESVPISKKLPEQSSPIFSQAIETRDLQTIKSNKKKIKVALFLPLSGKNKDLGTHLFNAATMSLFDNDPNNNIELVAIDSKNLEEDTAKNFDKNIVKQGIKIVIGPVFSQSIEAIKPLVKANKITLISFSNNQKLANFVDKDSGIFLAGYLLETEIDKIVSYCLEKGKKNFAIVAPNNQYGITANNLLKKIVKDRDGVFVASELYQNNKDIVTASQTIVNSFTTLSKTKNKIVAEGEKIYPQVILIPESGQNLSKIIANIKKSNVEERDLQIIGTSQWDDISTLNNSDLVGAWFASPEVARFNKFEKSYYQTFGKNPPRISAIAYDLVAAISELINKKDNKEPILQDFINYTNSKKGFSGIDGLFRFLPNGLVQRNLAVLEVGENKFETLEKPADEFLKY